MVSRRGFLKSSVALGAASLAAPAALFSKKVLAQAVPALFNPALIQQFVNPLPRPALHAPVGTADIMLDGVNTLTVPKYRLTITETKTSFGLGATVPQADAWGYNGQVPGASFDLPPETGPIVVEYVNGLPAEGTHYLPIDETLDWANPGGLGGLAPVPLVAHLHGADSANDENAGNPVLNTRPEYKYLSDGHPDAWGTPDAATPGLPKYPGRLFSYPYVYENRQESGHLWYHDHTLGITRQNVYMGLAGNYFLRDKNEVALQSANVIPSGLQEVPLVIADRQFTADGQLYYPSVDPAFPNLTVTHLPEFFGDVVTVNGSAWPVLAVEPRKYRFRLLNGSDSRVYTMRLSRNDGKGNIPMLVIGNELGFLNAAVQVDVLNIAPGERYDVVVDFATVKSTLVTMTNTAGSPFPNGKAPANKLTDRIMAFSVSTLATGTSATVVAGTPLRITVPQLPPVKDAAGNVLIPVGEPQGPPRRILLFEGTDELGRLQTMLGPVDSVPNKDRVLVQGTLTYKDPITELPKVGDWEVWEFYNTTVDAHPIHMHLVDFRVLDRTPFTAALTPKQNSDRSIGAVLNPATIVIKANQRVDPAPEEQGKKDTVITYPGTVTRVLTKFQRKGEYVYHCHILSHEDHEMMRPYLVE